MQRVAVCALAGLHAAGGIAGCTIVQSFVEPAPEIGPERCTNGRDDDLDGAIDAEQLGCSPYWPVPVQLPEPPAWACARGLVPDGIGACTDPAGVRSTEASGCHAGWRPRVLAEPDGTEAAIAVPVAVCEPARDANGTDAGCAEAVPDVSAARVRAGASAGGDGSVGRPYPSLRAALAGGATSLWLEPGIHEATDPIVIAADVEVSMASACDAVLGVSGAELLVVSGRLSLRRITLRGDVRVEPRGLLAIERSTLEPGTAGLVVRVGLDGVAELDRVRAADATEGAGGVLRLELDATSTVTVTNSVLGELVAAGRNARLVLAASSIWAADAPVAAVSGPFASVDVRDVWIARRRGSSSESALISARQDAELSVSLSYLEPGAGGALELEGAAAQGIVTDVVVAGDAEAALDPPGAPMLGATHGAALSLSRVALLSPASDGVVAHGDGTTVSANDLTVYRDSRCRYEGEIPATTSAVRSVEGACLSADGLYIEGVDGSGIFVEGTCAPMLSRVTVDRVRSRDCRDGLRGFEGVGVLIGRGVAASLTQFLVRRTNGCGVLYDRHAIVTEGALLENVSGLCTWDLTRIDVPAAVVFRDNGSDSATIGGCFVGTSVGCGSRLPECP
ncbi:MAG: hypothetical protein IT379_19030 [Deltaproteobacteria bacterium]|nr:hypothetical protein [Deltaproteobacteria bacterium]